MRRIIKTVLGENKRTKRSHYLHAGFQSYENRFAEITRPCSCCTTKAQHDKECQESAPKRPGLFQ